MPNSTSIDPSAHNLNTVFTIVVCGQVYNISWKSLLSDGPNNFFTRHFLKAKLRIIHIDRNPDTFTLIIRHLRGYPFVYLNIGGTSFRLKWDLFNKDGPHNYFTGPLKHALLSPHPTLGESAPIHIERDPETFKDIIRHLQGYSIHIRDEQHRLHLLSDAQFYLFKKLRDKLKTSVNIEERHIEILLRIEDVKWNQLEIVDTHVYYLQDKKIKPMSLTVQLDDFNISCHRSLNTTTTFFLEHDFSKTIKDPRWSVALQVQFNKDCAIYVGEEPMTLSQYLLTLNTQNPCPSHTNCSVQWIGIEKAIAKTSCQQVKSISLHFEKLLVIKSRIQANMKRDFLSTAI
ncbi:unnamed protein product [Mucor hiemalis]